VSPSRCAKRAARGRWPSAPRVQSAWLTLAMALAGPAVRAADPPSPGAAATVEAVVVTANKLAVQTLIDRKVYSLQADVQSSFGTVSDVLSVIPSVDVDADGNVSLRGDSNVLILIDGRRSAQFSGASAGDNLQSIPARDIERIEVITNPPAQYKADGAAGVINIVTRKKRPPGLAGTLQGSLGTGGRSTVGANAGYSAGPLTASLTATYRQDYKQRLIQSDVVAPDPTTGQLVDHTSAINETIRRAVPPVGLSVQYALNDRQTVSIEASRSGRAGLRTYTERNASTLQSGAVTAASRRLSAGHDREIDGDERLGYSQKLGGKGAVLDLSLHRSTSHENEHYDYTNDSFVPPAATYYNNLGFHEDHRTTELNADYTAPLVPARMLKLGYAFERADYGYGAAGNNLDPATGAQVPNPSLSDDFKFRQQVNAVYLSYQSSVGAWSWLGGLRGELADTAARLTANVSTVHSYLRLYPSLHAERSLSDHSTLSFGASRRVARPDPGSLNPYVDYEYTPNLAAGNPDLKPQITQSYELGYGFEGRELTYGLTGYYRRNKDSVTSVTGNLGNGLAVTTTTNLPRNDAAGLELTSNGRIGAQLAYSVSGNLYYSQIDATALGARGLASTTGLNAKIKLDYRPTAADAAQITMTRTDKRLTAQGYAHAINIVNLGYRHQMQADLTAVVTLSDLFNGQRYERSAVTPTFTANYLRYVRGRIVYFGLVYAFGSSRKEKQPSFEYDQ
jgi:outer membrane receptor for ferrienterochelin and colicin